MKLIVFIYYNLFISMSDNNQPQVRCVKCNKLLAKNSDGHFEIKCERCGTLNKALELMIEQVVITDPEGKILFINKAFENITGFTLHESIGKKPSELWGGHMPKEFYADLWDKMKNKKGSIKVKMTNQKKSGESYELELIVSPILDTKGDILFFVGIEVVVK